MEVGGDFRSCSTKSSTRAPNKTAHIHGRSGHALLNNQGPLEPKLFETLSNGSVPRCLGWAHPRLSIDDLPPAGDLVGVLTVQIEFLFKFT